MYVHIRKSGRNRYVYIMEAYRTKDSKVAHRTIEKLGRYDLLEAKDPNFLEKLKNNLKIRSQIPKYEKLELENRWYEKQGENNCYSRDNESAYTGMPVYSYANRLLRYIFRKILNLEYCFSYMQTQHVKTLPFSLANLVFHRILAKFFAGTACQCGTKYFFLDDSFDLKEEHGYLPQIHQIIAKQQERLLSFMLNKALKNANLPVIAQAFNELDASTYNSFMQTMQKLPDDDKKAKILKDSALILNQIQKAQAQQKYAGRSFLNEFESLVTKAMLEIIKDRLSANGHNYSISEISESLKHANLTAYIPPHDESNTIYLKLAGPHVKLYNLILESFDFEPPLNCSLKNDLLRALKIKYCSNRKLLGPEIFNKFVISTRDA